MFARLTGIVCFFICLSVQAAPELLKPENDHRQYRFATLDNGLRVLLISDAKAQKAAASLDVHIGSGEDPNEREGLAHFLEHMLFLGTEKYPEPGAYQRFITSQGGAHNAYTSFEHTNYFFDVNAKAFPQALDRFSQFFIAPRFNKEYIKREKQAVHSEYQGGLQSDFRRYYDVYRELLTPQHPAKKFSVGSLETLADRPGSNLRQEMLAFYQRYYSANLMTLVLLSPDDLDSLEKLARQYFSPIPNRHTQITISELAPFPKGFLPAEVQWRPVKEKRLLSLTFPVPETRSHWRSKPLSFIGFFLGHEGEGSLLAVLKEKGWVQSLSAGESFSDRSATTFQLSMELTKAGFNHRDEIIQLAFAAVAQLKQQGISKWRFEEIQQLKRLAFRFQETSDPIHAAMSLSNLMHELPNEALLWAQFYAEDFKPELIGQYLEYLRPDNLLVAVGNPDLESTTLSRRYLTPYQVEEISPQRQAQWQGQSSLAASLALPKPNPFIPEQVVKQDLPSLGDEPRLAVDNQALRFWYLPDREFNQPKVDLRLRFFVPAVKDSPREAALNSLLIALLQDQLNETGYAAAMAELYFSLNAHNRGFEMGVQGFTDKLPVLLDEVMETLQKPSWQEERYEVLKADLQRRWRNRDKVQPYQRLLYEVSQLLYRPLWDDDALLAAAEALTFSDLQHFARDYFKGVRVQALAVGQVSEEQARHWGGAVQTLLAANKASLWERFRQWLWDKPQAVPVVGQITRVPLAASGEVPLRHLQLPHNDESAVLYVQGELQANTEQEALREEAAMMLLEQTMKAPFFHQLRTEQQLGYSVFAFNMPVRHVPGAALVVQSSSASSDEIQQAIEAFIGGFPQHLQALSPAEFAQHRQALLMNLNLPDKNLRERTGRLWGELSIGYQHFDRRQRLSALVENINQEDLVKYFERRFVNQPHQMWLTGSRRPKEGQGIVYPDTFKRRHPYYLNLGENPM